MAIVTTMCKLLFSMAIGFYLYKAGMFTPETNAKMSAVIVKVTCPCLLLYSISTVDNGESSTVLAVFAAGIAAYILFIAIGFLFSKVFCRRAELRPVYMCMLIFSNNIFMGVPVVQSLIGDRAIFYITIFNMSFNFLYFTIGLYLLNRNEDGTGNEKFSFRRFLNPGILASLLSLLIFFTKMPVPDIIYSCLNFVGSITTPLSMIIIGSSIAAASVGEVREERALIPMLIFRLLVIPAVVYFLMSAIGFEADVVKICTLGAGMPVASMVAMGSASHPVKGKTASLGVAVSTIVSMATIPVMAVLLGL